MPELPPLNVPIYFLAGEFGTRYQWYPGFAWKSEGPGQEVVFFIYPWFFGFPMDNPLFHAPPYRGAWSKINDPKLLDLISRKR